MIANLYEIQFDGGILQRGFWLYIWQITQPSGETLYYVGRTGDSSSTNAQSPFNRMGQHLGFAENSNMLRRHLERNQAVPETCRFRLVALGPLEEESKSNTRHEHDLRRDLVAAMEKALAELLAKCGCHVMNTVASRTVLDVARFAKVRQAFEEAFPEVAVAKSPDRADGVIRK